MSRRGHTLAEIVVAVSILGLMMIALGWVYVMGQAAARQADAVGELSTSLQLVSTRVSRALEHSAVSALLVTPTAVSCQVAADRYRQLRFETHAGGELAWQRYEVFWWDPAALRVLWRDLDVAPGSPQRTRPAPITSLAPLATWMTGGQVVGRHIRKFQASHAGRLVRLELEAERNTGRKLERVVQSLTVRVRN